MSDSLEQLGPGARAWATKVLQAHPELTESGRVLVVEAARSRETIAAAERALAHDGYIIEGLHGPKSHPAEAMARNARAQLLRILIALNIRED